MWVALLVLLTISAFVNGDVKVALLGHPDRHLGVLTWVLFFALFCAGQQLTDQVRTLARCAVVAGALTSVYSVWELLFGPPVSIDASTRRLVGPLGSAAFLGAACCLLGPIAVGVAFDRSEDRSWRRISAGVAFLTAVSVVGSGTRAAWFGLLIAAAVAVIAVQPRWRSIACCTAGVLVAVAIVAPRLSDVTTRSEGTGSRLDEWRIGTRVIDMHPMTGVGPEGYRIAVSEGIDDVYERAYRRDTVLPDRAHSGPLDVALAGGVGAGLLYVALIGFVGWRAWLAIRSRRALAAGLACAVIAYGAQQLLLFPLAELDPVWWVLAGVVVASTTVAEPIVHRRTIVPALAATASIIMLVAGVLDVAADRQARTALRAVDHDVSVDAARRAVTLRPDNLRYRLVAANALLDRGTLADIDAAIAEAREATEWSANDPFAADELATAMSRRAAATGDRADVNAAFAQWRALTARDPHRASWQLQFGRAAALAGDAATARKAFLAAADLGEPGARELLAQLDASS
ncbi:MAG: O-antigen ligase family protein [Ilumatobacteraceae bacterium]